MSVGQTPLKGYRYSAGVGYITLASDLGREEYIKYCFQTGTVSIKMEDNSVSHRVRLPLEVLNFIEFPLTLDENGSGVVWVNNEITSAPIIVGRLPLTNEQSDLEEHRFRFTRVFGDNVVEITGSSKEGSLLLTVDGRETSNIDLIVYNKNKQGKLNLTCQGGIHLFATEELEIEGREVVLKNNVDDSNSQVTISPGEVKVETERFEIGEGTEALLLGYKTVKFIEKFLDTIYQSTVTTQLGQMPLLNKEAFKEMKKELESLLSTLSFTD